jgi:hypothetical protein
MERNEEKKRNEVLITPYNIGKHYASWKKPDTKAQITFVGNVQPRQIHREREGEQGLERGEKGSDC